MTMPWDFALLFFVLAVLVPWRGVTRIRKLLARPRLDTRDRLALYASTIAFQCFAAAVVAWRSHARGLTGPELGLTFSFPASTIASTVAVSLLLISSQLYSLRRMAQAPAQRRGPVSQMAHKILPQNYIEALAFVPLLITVAFCEEFLYRGFAFAVMHKTSGSALFAALASSVMFALAHAYQGRTGVFATFVVGLAFVTVRSWTASLAPGIVAHLLADGVAGLGASKFLDKLLQAQEPGAPPRAGSGTGREA